MADTAAYAYDCAAVDLALGDLRWSDGEFGVVLADRSYQPRQSQDVTLRDLRSARVSESVRLTGRSVDDSVAGRIVLRAQGVRFALRDTVEFQYAVVYNERTERLVAYSDLGPQKVTDGIAVVAYPDGEVCELVVGG